jgi:hypothetical protein
MMAFMMVAVMWVVVAVAAVNLTIWRREPHRVRSPIRIG